MQNISNEIISGPCIALPVRSKDAQITASLKSQLLNSSDFQINHVRVITEHSIASLTGLVKGAQVEKTSELVSGIPDVINVVKVFEYLD